MRVIADFHIHGCYSRATSERMHLEEIARFARIKGLNVVGTGDFTHPRWLREIQEILAQESDTSLYRVAENPESQVLFMFTSEVSTVFTYENETRKIHHVLFTPNIETAGQINGRLEKYGDLASDGRPTLNMDAPHLVEEVMEVSSDNMIFPAHVWTPWFSLFGAFSGFSKIEDCYQDMTKHIYALETGLSSDPPMNWRLSKLDKYTLVSNSDSHSPWPWRLGREANVFEMKRSSYHEILNIIRTKDTQRFRFTIETNPAYGKYHWTGHRNCNVALPPHSAAKLGSICPVCRRKLTKGVEQRVEELADRPKNFKPASAINYVRLLPLSEIIKTVQDASSPYVRKVWDVHNQLTGRFGNEYQVLIDATAKELKEVVDEAIADAIIRVRKGRVKVVPGFDGVYGQLILSEDSSDPEECPEEFMSGRVQQQSLTDFI